MNIESQVVNLELSKRLKELGVNRESQFIWICVIKTKFNFIKFRESFEPDSEIFGAFSYPSFNASELFEMLPACIDIQKEEPFNFYWLHLQKRTASNIQYIMNYRCDSFSPEVLQRVLLIHNIYDENLCDCLAKLLIHLIENEYIEI